MESDSDFLAPLFLHSKEITQPQYLLFHPGSQLSVLSSGSQGLALRGQGLSQVHAQSLPSPGREIQKLSEAGEAAP